MVARGGNTTQEKKLGVREGNGGKKKGREKRKNQQTRSVTARASREKTAASMDRTKKKKGKRRTEKRERKLGTPWRGQEHDSEKINTTGKGREKRRLALSNLRP